MMFAKIYQPARNAMQSGQAKTHQWVLEMSHESARKIDPLMGWTSSDDTQSQVKIVFESKEAAIEFATSKGIAFGVKEPSKRKHNVRSNGYAENFATDRKGAWTH